MKKRIVALLLCATTIFTMTACSKKDDTAEGTEVSANTESSEEANPMPVPDLAKYSFTYSDYVTLGDYSAVPVELSESYEVTEEDVENFLVEWFTSNSPFYVADETKTVVEEGDIVNVNYVGKLDGVAFEGGSAENQTIDVSGNCSADGYTTYIDGFTTGLLGAKVGTEVDCDVTFPKDYQSTDLAGKAVVFTFTVNSIQRPMAYEEIDDAFAAEYAGEDSVEAMYDVVRTSLVNEADYYKASEMNSDIQEYLLDVCTVEIPADYFADLLNAYHDVFVYTNCDGDESKLEEFLSTNYGYTVEEAEQMWTEALKMEVQMEFILGAIAEKEGITLDQEAYESDLADLLSYYGLTSTDTIFQTYGYGDLVYGEMRMKNMHVQSQIIDMLKENAVVTVAEPSEEPSTETTAE